VIDLDANATTQPCEEAVRAMAEAMTDLWRNPSSPHRAGQEARRRVELARGALAGLVGAPPKSLIFTSSATESVDLAIRGSLRLDVRRDRPAVVTSPAEHAAVRELVQHLDRCGRIEARWAPVTREGLIDPEALAPLLEGAAMCSIQWVSSETGAIQPVEAIAHLCHECNVLYHCDATQWVGKMPTDLAAMDERGAAPNLLSFAPHKFHGPKGVGILVATGPSPDATLRGAQELGRRAGTENVPGILGAGAAAEAAARWLQDPALREHQRILRDRLESQLLKAIPGARVSGPPPSARVWNTTNLLLPEGLDSEPLLLALSERGVGASAGSACSSGSLEPSEVLLAMGLSEDEARRSLRFSISRMTTEAEIDAAATQIAGATTRLTL
jgi:cysteine desulfurase